MPLKEYVNNSVPLSDKTKIVNKTSSRITHYTNIEIDFILRETLTDKFFQQFSADII